MKNEKRTLNLNFNAQLFWKSKNYLVSFFISQLLYRNDNQNFLSNFVYQFMKKIKLHFRYTDYPAIWSCKNGRYEGSFIDDSVIARDKVNRILTKNFPTNISKKKEEM